MSKIALYTYRAVMRRYFKCLRLVNETFKIIIYFLKNTNAKNHFVFFVERVTSEYSLSKPIQRVFESDVFRFKKLTFKFTKISYLNLQPIRAHMCVCVHLH